MYADVCGAWRAAKMTCRGRKDHRAIGSLLHGSHYGRLAIRCCAWIPRSPRLQSSHAARHLQYQQSSMRHAAWQIRGGRARRQLFQSDDLTRISPALAAWRHRG